MAEHSTARERRLLNRVTVIKLALQLLDRRTELSEQQRGLVRAALAAADGLTADLVEGWRAERAPAAEERGRSPATREAPDARH